MFNRLRAVSAAAMLAVAISMLAIATAEDLRSDRPDPYAVQPGDTLWSIAGRFLQKPWQWPQIWQANPQLRDPDRIYPGDLLHLTGNAPARAPARIALQPGPRQHPPIDAIALAQVEPFLRDLRVTERFEQLPYVAGFEDSHLRGTSGQLAYIKGLTQAQPGQRYALLRPGLRFSLPRLQQDLDSRGERFLGTGTLWRSYIAPESRREALGYELTQVNQGTVTRVGAGTLATTLLLDEGGREVRPGDRVVPIEPQRYDLQFVPHPPSPQALAVKPRVLAVADAFSAAGPHDVIALSGGLRDGIDNGTVFSLWRQSGRVNDRIEHKHYVRIDDGHVGGSTRTVGIPDEYAAHAMVFRSFDRVSYALIMEGVKPVLTGYALRHPDAH